MMIRQTALLFAATGLLAVSAAAQTRTLHTLLKDPGTSATRLARQLATCATPNPACAASLPITVGWAGGLAHAPSRDTLWYTNGTHLVEKTVACATPCTVAGVRSLGANSSIGGLAIGATRGELFQVESIGGQAAITTYALTFPCPTPVNTSPLQLPTTQHRSGALAYDGSRDHLFVAVSAFQTTFALNYLYVMQRTPTGGWSALCVVPFGACNGALIGPVQGMAYDEYRRVLWVADRSRLYEQSLSYRTGCPTLTSLSCCGKPGAEEYHGIEVEVGSVTELGASCSPAGCSNCLGMRLAARGRPIVGNTQFQLQITNGPVGSAAFLVLAAGPCSPVPYGCGTIYPSLATPWLAVPIGNLAGPSACVGSAILTMTIPADYGVCGQTLCSQGIVVCPSAVALTNGVEFTIEG